jgi:peroxiredoxin Q/BCP
VVRSTFVIDMHGVVRHALYDVHPRGHAAAVFQLVKELDRTCRSPKTQLSRSNIA